MPISRGLENEVERLRKELAIVAEGERLAMEAAKEVADYFGVLTAPVTEDDGIYYEMCVRVRGIIAAYDESQRATVDMMMNGFE